MTDYIRDGHTLALTLGTDGEIGIELVCPVGELNKFAKLPFEQQPPCHRIVDENGEPDEDSGTYCNVRKWCENTGTRDYLAVDMRKDFPVKELPVRVEWAFVDWDEVSIRPYKEPACDCGCASSGFDCNSTRERNNRPSTMPAQMQDGKRYAVTFAGEFKNESCFDCGSHRVLMLHVIPDSDVRLEEHHINCATRIQEIS